MSDNTARAFWITDRDRGEIRSHALAPLPEDMVRVETDFTAISRGTESLVLRGGVPESQAGAMRAPFQEGDFPWPVKYGYSAVGWVEAGPPDLLGRPVFCLHPHQDRFQVPVSAVFPLPADLPPARAVLAANMETAVNALWDAQPLAGEQIAVIGAGALGCLVARLAARIPGTSVQLVDVAAAKAAVAEVLEVAFAGPENALGQADLVIHASGRPEGLETALRLAGLEARIVEMSWYGDRIVPLPLGEAFHSRRLKLISSQVGRLPDHRRARWDHRRRLGLALDLLRDPVFDMLISGEDWFEHLPQVLPRVAADPTVLCHRIRYR